MTHNSYVTDPFLPTLEIWSPLPSETDSHPFRYYTKYQFTDSLTCDIYSLPAITKNVTEKNYMIEIE